MRVYLDKTVLEMARERIRFLLDEFENVVVNVSGGKDSTVIYHLTREIAAEEGHDEPYVFWIDQEAEWGSTVDIVERWMTADGVRPIWTQMPMKMTNATSDTEDFLHCWDPDAEGEWIHEKHPISIKENTYGTDRFAELFEAVIKAEVGQPTCMIGGVRTEESRNRFMGLTSFNTYKGITYGRHDTEDIYTIYPIYDWTYADVWKFIHDRDLEYNDIYDWQYRHGVPVKNMRVSNLHHETAVHSLFRLQEFEPETYDALVNRIGGIHAAATMGAEDYFPDELPFMFRDWREYRNFLLDRLVEDPEHRLGFKRSFFQQDMLAEHLPNYGSVLREHVRAILANDWEGDSILNNALREINFNENQAVARQKKEWLREERPDVWADLEAQGVVGGA